MGRRTSRRRAASGRSAAGAVPEPAGPDHAGWIAGGVALLAFAGYALTVAPGVTLVDSGELVLAAWSQGSAHPPGFPFYLALAHLATLVPLGSVALRVNVVSGVFAALAASAFVMLLAELLRGLRERPSAVVLGAAGLTLGFARTLWAYATIAEVYTLNLALILAAFAAILRWRRTTDVRALFLGAAVFGLGLGVHHATVLVCAPALLLLGLTPSAPRALTPRLLALALAVALLTAVACYGYLAWCASAQPVMNWGDPSTPLRLFWHASGRQYQVNFEFSAASVARELRAFADLLPRQFGPAYLPLALCVAGWGLVRLLRRDSWLGLALLLVVAADVALGACYEIAEDKDAYYLPAFAALALFAGIGLQAAWTARARLLVLLVPGVAIAGNFHVSDRRADRIAPDLVASVTAAAPARSVLLTHEWQFFAPYWYLREVEGVRRDCCVVNVNLMRRSWYFDDIARACPELAAAARAETSTFLVDLRRWEADPDAFARDTALRAQITASFQAAVLAFARHGQAAGGTFATPDVVIPELSPDPDLARVLVAGSALVPQGLAFQLATTQEFIAPAANPLPARGLFDGTLELDPTSAAVLKVRPLYLAMVMNRGLYLAQHQRKAEAAAALRQALALDPGHRPARLALERLEAQP